MNTTFRRRRAGRVLTVLSGLLVLTAAAGWIRSCMYLDRLEYRFGELRGQAASGVIPNEWEFHARAASVHHHMGTVFLGLSRYISLSNDGDALALQWADWPGWSRVSLPQSEVVMRVRDEWYYESPVEWRAGPLGLFTVADKGEVARALSFPYWLVILFGGIPLWITWLRARRAHRRRMAGCCTRCGYDLRGSIGAACPECGSKDGTVAEVK
ncbi:MAG: hypothetical protein IPM64_09975 [Phycisphaerales bacterium]|nr:hypothetical protein [Phycisphaerales bacterium]